MHTTYKILYATTLSRGEINHPILYHSAVSDRDVLVESALSYTLYSFKE
jgi:hypothetical protein